MHLLSALSGVCPAEMEQDLAALSARCDFCEASYENLKKELKIYFHRQKGICRIEWSVYCYPHNRIME